MQSTQQCTQTPDPGWYLFKIFSQLYFCAFKVWGELCDPLCVSYLPPRLASLSPTSLYPSIPPPFPLSSPLSLSLSLTLTFSSLSLSLRLSVWKISALLPRQVVWGGVEEAAAGWFICGCQLLGGLEATGGWRLLLGPLAGSEADPISH